ncbi:MAG: hypothetical protein HY720_13570 [Planctomycetes bacterium]|nr:hypothetical protein [Planctomycetota bacterium]
MAETVGRGFIPRRVWVASYGPWWALVASLALLALAPISARAQDASKVSLEVLTFDVIERSEGEKYIQVSVQSNLPEETSVTFKLKFELEDIPYLWQGIYLEKNGTGLAEIGPLDKKLLPGVYDAILVVDPLEQNPDAPPGVLEFWKKFSAPFERVAKKRIGTETEEATLRGEAKRLIMAEVAKIETALAEVKTNEEDLRTQKGRFYGGGRFHEKEFIAWADGIVAPLASLVEFIKATPTDCYVPYYAAVHKYLFTSVLLHYRYAWIDYTIYKVLEWEKVEIPDRFKPEEGGLTRPTREAAFAIGRRDLLKVRKLLGEAPALDPLDVYVPKGEDVPQGFEIGAVPEDLTGLFPENPIEYPLLGPSETGPLSEILGGFEIPDGYDVSALFYCLVPPPPKDGREPPPPDPKKRVVVLVLRFSDEGMAFLPVMEASRTDRKEKLRGTMLARDETVVLLVPGEDPDAKKAAELLDEWYRSKFGFDTAGKTLTNQGGGKPPGEGENGGGKGDGND